MTLFHRSTLEFGLPLLESPLDYQSSWNEAYFHTWFLKMFYSRSSLQCNSVIAINGGEKYHVNRGEGAYVYKQGFQWPEIRALIKEHIDMTRTNNPLFKLFNTFDQFGGKERRNGWGIMSLDPGIFNITNTIDFGFGFNLDVFKFFDVCSRYIQVQAKWWRSGICRYVRSKEITKAVDLFDAKEKCQDSSQHSSRKIAEAELTELSEKPAGWQGL